MAAVRASGTGGLVGASVQRWFGPGFPEREPGRASALLDALRYADDDGYVAVCGALADFDVRDRLGEITRPVLAVAGAADEVTPPAGLDSIVWTGVARAASRLMSPPSERTTCSSAPARTASSPRRRPACRSCSSGVGSRRAPTSWA